MDPETFARVFEGNVDLLDLGAEPGQRLRRARHEVRDLGIDPGIAQRGAEGDA